ncbi:MAG TPA: tagaturonate epimerase family protein, partial [Candidatus Methylacidiphilales bacterium]
MKPIHPYTLGCGDRFGREGLAQLEAFALALREGIDVCPVWNKSNREHDLIGSQPVEVRAEAEAAVKALGWNRPYYVDADHIGLKTVDRFLAPCDFFTLDVADFIGKPAATEAVDAFVARWKKYIGRTEIPGLGQPLAIDEALMRAAASKFLFAMQEAGKIYRHVEERRAAPFVTEVSIDETDAAQTPVELFLILLMLAQEKVPVQTIAPKFTGRFNKGVDYVGDLAAFEREFDADIAIVAFAVRELGLPASLKLSVHSGSDKFSLYPIIGRLVRKHRTGLH